MVSQGSALPKGGWRWQILQYPWHTDIIKCFPSSSSLDIQSSELWAFVVAFLSKLSKNGAELQQETRTCPCDNQIQQLCRLLAGNHLHPGTAKGRRHTAMGLRNPSGRCGEQGEQSRNAAECRVRVVGSAGAPELLQCREN